MEAGKRAPHTQTPPRSTTGQVPAFHLAALPRVRRWSRWYGVWLPGSCSAISLAPVDHLTRLCDSVRLGVLPSSGASTSQQWRQLMPMSCEGIAVLLAKDVMKPVRLPIWRQGFSALTSLCPRKVVGYDQSWVCTYWTGPFINLLSRCSRRSASSDAAVPEIGLQRLTWRTRTSMCWSFRATGQSCGLRSKDGHISTRSCPSGCPYRPMSSRK